MPPIAGAAATGTTAMDALAYGAQGGAQPPGTPQGAGIQGADQLRQKTEAAVTMIRQYAAQLQQLQQLVPGSDQIIAQMQRQLRQLAVMAAQAGSVQNQSADNLPL